jgi:hypothetical protein
MCFIVDQTFDDFATHVAFSRSGRRLARRVSSPAGADLLLFCLSKREVGKRKRHPNRVPRCAGAAGGAGVWHPCLPRCAALSSPPTSRSKGPREITSRLIAVCLFSAACRSGLKGLANRVRSHRWRLPRPAPVGACRTGFKGAARTGFAPTDGGCAATCSCGRTREQGSLPQMEVAVNCSCGSLQGWLQGAARTGFAPTDGGCAATCSCGSEPCSCCSFGAVTCPVIGFMGTWRVRQPMGAYRCSSRRHHLAEQRCRCMGGPLQT